VVDNGAWISSILERDPGSKAGAHCGKRFQQLDRVALVKVCVMDAEQRYLCRVPAYTGRNSRAGGK
jgi:hypothetical protein